MFDRKRILGLSVLLLFTWFIDGSMLNSQTFPQCNGAKVEKLESLEKLISRTPQNECLLVSVLYRVPHDTVLSNSLKIVNGGGLYLEDGASLEMRGSLEAGPHPIFYGPGRIRGLQVTRPEWFGAYNVTYTDEALSIYYALQALQYGGTLHFDDRSYSVDSATMAGQTIGGKWTLPADNITIEGEGASISKIVVEGTTACGLFYSLNRSGVTVRNLGFYGNNIATGGGAEYLNGSAIAFKADNSASSDGLGFIIENCTLENFKSAYWVWFLNTGTTYSIRQIWIRNNRFVSHPDNSQDPDDPTDPAVCVNLMGDDSEDSKGYVQEFFVIDNYAECTYIKAFCWAWKNVKFGEVCRNQIFNVGRDENYTYTYAYAILLYAGTNSTPDHILVSGNNIYNPFSCGVYAASSQNLQFIGNYIYGQTDTDDSAIPRAGIALNGCKRVLITGCIFENDYRGVTIVGSDPNGLLDVTISGCSFVHSSASNVSILVKANEDAYTHKGLTITGNRIVGSQYGIAFMCTDSLGFEQILINGNNFDNTRSCIEVVKVSGSFTLWGNATLTSNRFRASSGVYGVCIPDSSIGKITISSNDFSGQLGASGVLLALYSSDSDYPVTGLHISNNSFRDQYSNGYCLLLQNAQGSLEGNRFYNVANNRQISTSADEDLGYDQPTWSGDRGSFIQVLMPSESGSSGSKYVCIGLINVTTGSADWKECRVLTGN